VLTPPRITSRRAASRDCRRVATPAHKDRATQVWDAEVRAERTGKTIALFRCTQMILRARMTPGRRFG
jgi:acyl-coenzyme A thioesterase PaaI-like protein